MNLLAIHFHILIQNNTRKMKHVSRPNFTAKHNSFILSLCLSLWCIVCTTYMDAFLNGKRIPAEISNIMAKNNVKMK